MMAAANQCQEWGPGLPAKSFDFKSRCRQTTGIGHGTITGMITGIVTSGKIFCALTFVKRYKIKTSQFLKCDIYII